jgi:hypothetical protein
LNEFKKPKPDRKQSVLKNKVKSLQSPSSCSFQKRLFYQKKLKLRIGVANTSNSGKLSIQTEYCVMKAVKPIEKEKYEKKIS